MILALYGHVVSEERLRATARMEPGGVDIEELARLALEFEMTAEIVQLDRVELAAHIRVGVFPICYVNRFHWDQEYAVHSVIPIRLTARSVAMYDPLIGERRVSIRKFDTARESLSNWSVVCRPHELRVR